MNKSLFRVVDVCVSGGLLGALWVCFSPWAAGLGFAFGMWNFLDGLTRAARK